MPIWVFRSIMFESCVYSLKQSMCHTNGNESGLYMSKSISSRAVNLYLYLLFSYQKETLSSVYDIRIDEYNLLRAYI